MAAGQLIAQAEFQKHVFRPTDQEQIMQIVIFVAMFVGALAYYVWNIKPFLVVFSQASAVWSAPNHNALISLSDITFCVPRTSHGWCHNNITWQFLGSYDSVCEAVVWTMEYVPIMLTCVALRSGCALNSKGHCAGTQENGATAESTPSRH